MWPFRKRANFPVSSRINLVAYGDSDTFSVEWSGIPAATEAWLISTIGSDLYERIIKGRYRSSEADDLTAQVASVADIPFSGLMTQERARKIFFRKKGPKRMIRTLIRRWLGIHDDDLIRAAILAEIDADAVWHNRPENWPSAHALKQLRRDRAYERDQAIRSGRREAPGA